MLGRGEGWRPQLVEVGRHGLFGISRHVHSFMWSVRNACYKVNLIPLLSILTRSSRRIESGQCQKVSSHGRGVFLVYREPGNKVARKQKQSSENVECDMRSHTRCGVHIGIVGKTVLFEGKKNRFRIVDSAREEANFEQPSDPRRPLRTG